MVDWEITATTIFCDSVRDEVTIIVQEDGSVKCSGTKKYEIASGVNKNVLKKTNKAAGKHMTCLGDHCTTVKQYRDKLMDMK
jgi:hypothetical protein